MTRHTLESAIGMGLRRTTGQALQKQIDSIVLAIELAIDMSGGQQLTSTDAAPTKGKSPDSDISSLPPSPESVVPAPVLEVEAVKETVAIDRTTTNLPPPEPRLIVEATMADIDTERSKHPPKVKSIFLGGRSTRKTMLNVAEWCANNFPATIMIRPRDIDHDIELRRNIMSYPCAGENMKHEKESVVKLVYKHPNMDSSMEVGQGIRVGDIEENGWPPVEVILNAIKDQAREMYRKREKYIEGRAPEGPPLEQSLRMTSAAIDDLRKGKRPQNNTGSITFGDADEGKNLQHPESA